MQRLKIVLVIENMSFPRDRRVRQEALALASNGYAVSVVCPRGSDRDTRTFEDYLGISVYRYRQYWHGSGPISYALEYGWAVLATFLLLVQLWLRKGVDVIHVANPPDLLFLAAAPFKVVGKKFVYDQHDLSPEMFEAKFGHRGALYSLLVLLERWSYHLADLVIVTNQSFHDIALRRGLVDRRLLWVVRNGPDLRSFHAVPPCPELKRQRSFLVCYAGMMGVQDGVNRVILAAAHIVKVRGRRDVLFVLLGSGDCLPQLKALVQQEQLQEYVHFTGWVGDRDLLTYLSTADVCLAPDPPVTMNQLSTMIKIMEYMSCGKPIVSFDLVESRRSAGDAAVYVTEDDITKFGDAILELLENAERRRMLGDAGLARLRAELHWEKSQEHLLNAYRSLLDGTGAS